MSTHEPSSSGPSQTTSHPRAPRKRDWIKRLPKIVKKSKHYNFGSSFTMVDPVDSPIGLLALFGWRIAPTILTDLQEDPANIPPTYPQEEPVNVTPNAVQENRPDIPPTAVNEDPPRMLLFFARAVGYPSLPAAQEGATNMSLSTAQEGAVDTPLTSPNQQIPPKMTAYEIGCIGNFTHLLNVLYA